MDKTITLKILENETKEQTAERIVELYDTIASLCGLVDLLYGNVTDESEVRRTFENEDLKDHVFHKIMRKYGEAGMKFMDFAVAYELGKRSKVKE